MLLPLLSHLLCAWFAFALPSYATYKALTHQDPPDALRALATYWVVLAIFFAFEQSLGLVLSWLPFYWELRTIFLLYISLPQTQGSAYVYNSFLEPWCLANEADIDTAITSVQTNAIAFCRARIAALLDLVLSNNTIQSRPDQNPDIPKPAHTQAVPVDQLKGLWAAYGPSLLAAFAPKVSSDVHVTSTANDGFHQPYSAN